MIAARLHACVDCGMDLIGEQPRCPGCHDRHAVALAEKRIEVMEQADRRTLALVAKLAFIANAIAWVIVTLILVRSCTL